MMRVVFKNAGWPRAALLLAMVLLIRTAVRAQAPAAAEPASQPAVTSTAADGTAPLPKLSPLDLFWEAGFFIWPLSLCSVLSVALIIERFVALRRARVIPPGFLAGLKNVYADPREDREQALRYCDEHDSPLARMIGAGIRRLPRGPAA